MNQLQITALTVVVVVIWFWEIRPTKKVLVIEKRVEAVELRVEQQADVFEQIAIEKIGVGKWQEIKDQLDK